MEQRNIEGFENDHPGKKFPAFRSLTGDEMRKIRSVLKERLGLGESVGRLALTKAIADASRNCSEFDVESDTFRLRACLSKLDITPQNKIMINFYRFDDMDELLLEDVDMHFEYMWYPGSDDIDICDSTLSWVVSVSHDGEVSVVKF